MSVWPDNGQRRNRKRCGDFVALSWLAHRSAASLTQVVSLRQSNEKTIALVDLFFPWVTCDVVVALARLDMRTQAELSQMFVAYVGARHKRRFLQNLNQDFDDCGRFISPRLQCSYRPS